MPRALLALSAGILGVLAVMPKAGAAPVTIGLVQDSSQASLFSTSMTLTLPNSVRAGDALMASFNDTHDSLTITSVSGGGVRWIQGNQDNDAEVGDSEIWYGLNARGGPTTVTVDLDGTTDQQNPYYALNVSEWSGVGGLDQAPPGTADHSASSSSPALAPLISPIGSGDLFIGVMGTYGNCIPAGTPGGGFTSFPIETGLPNPGIQHSGYGYLVAPNALPQQYSQALTSLTPPSPPCEWAATEAAFYPPTPTPTPTAPFPPDNSGNMAVWLGGLLLVSVCVALLIAFVGARRRRFALHTGKIHGGPP